MNAEGIDIYVRIVILYVVKEGDTKNVSVNFIYYLFSLTYNLYSS